MEQKSYSEKLKDPKWQRKRLEILDRDDFTCQSCGSKDKTVHVHHKKYQGEPWEVDSKYLVTLCEDCHEGQSHESKQYYELFFETFLGSSFLADDLRQLAWGLSELKMQESRSKMALVYAFALADEEAQATLIKMFNDRIQR